MMKSLVAGSRIVVPHVIFLLPWFALGHYMFTGANTLQAQVANRPSSVSTPEIPSNAALPRFNRPGESLVKLSELGKANIISQAKPWRGLDFILLDGAGPALDAQMLERVYRPLSCQADLIATGHINEMASPHFSLNGTTIYTDYEFVIDTLIKGDPNLGPGSQIIVARLGGTIVQPDATPMKFDSEEFPRLLSGSNYMLMLHAVPQVGSYEFFDSFSTLIAAGDHWVIARKAYKNVLSNELIRNQFESSLRIWLSSCSKN